jgi:hypothetical protein
MPISRSSHGTPLFAMSCGGCRRSDYSAVTRKRRPNREMWLKALSAPGAIVCARSAFDKQRFSPAGFPVWAGRFMTFAPADDQVNGDSTAAIRAVVNATAPVTCGEP